MNEAGENAMLLLLPTLLSFFAIAVSSALFLKIRQELRGLRSDIAILKRNRGVVCIERKLSECRELLLDAPSYQRLSNIHAIQHNVTPNPSHETLTCHGDDQEVPNVTLSDCSTSNESRSVSTIDDNYHITTI